MWTFSLFFGERVRTGPPMAGFSLSAVYFETVSTGMKSSLSFGPYTPGFWKDETETLSFPLAHFFPDLRRNAQRVPDLALFRSGGNRKGRGPIKRPFSSGRSAIIKKNISTPTTPRPLFIFFPLYISEKSSNENKKIFLWPFFNFYTEKNFNYFQVDFPWPIIQYARGENAMAFKLLPFISYRKVDQRERLFLVWPIFYQEKEENDEKDEVLNRVFLFN